MFLVKTATVRHNISSISLAIPGKLFCLFSQTKNVNILRAPLSSRLKQEGGSRKQQCASRSLHTKAPFHCLHGTLFPRGLRHN